MFNITNNHSAKFEYKGMKTVGVTEYTTQTLSKHFEQKKMSKFKTPKIKNKIFVKWAQNRRCTHSLCKVFYIKELILLELKITQTKE